MFGIAPSKLYVRPPYVVRPPTTTIAPSMARARKSLPMTFSVVTEDTEFGTGIHSLRSAPMVTVPEIGVDSPANASEGRSSQSASSARIAASPAKNDVPFHFSIVVSLK